MCWFGHVLAVATENAAGNDLRLYSRELDLGRSPLYTEIFNMPIVFAGPSGEDSLLVYTYENILYHYVISIDGHKAQLIQVGQIAFHGVVRAPSRVRSVSWVVPESQLRNGDPSRDVEFASVLFLVDDKLVLLQPSRTPEDDLKYDLRVIAQHVEYYILMRDQLYFNFSGAEGSAPQTPSPGAFLSGTHSTRQEPFSLRDSLWTFTGTQLRLWPSIKDVLNPATTSAPPNTPLLGAQVTVPVDFYPLSILLTKGIVLGTETTLLQRRDTPFPIFRSDIRTQLFLPYVLRHQLLVANDHAAAFAAANQYQHLSYFPHALEILLHHVLDDEHERKRVLAKSGSKTADDHTSGDLITVSTRSLSELTLSPRTPTQATYHTSPGSPSLQPEPLPATLSFLSLSLSPAAYLSTLVQCIRKTEVTVWPTLFEHLPTPEQMFEDALVMGELKTAGGVLIIMQGMEDAELDEQSDNDGNESNDESEANLDAKQKGDQARQQLQTSIIRLMTLAFGAADYDLCAELARFVMGIDPTARMLSRIVREVPGLGGSTSLADAAGDTAPDDERSRQDTVIHSPPPTSGHRSTSSVGLGLSLPKRSRATVDDSAKVAREERSIGTGAAGGRTGVSRVTEDYFSASPGGY